MNKLSITNSYVPITGGSVYVRQWLPELVDNDIPILLIHDSLGCIEMWRDFPEQLAFSLRRRVIAYDRLGFGQSTPRQEPMALTFIDEEADIVFPTLCAALNLESVLLFGHSVGGGMAIAMASRFSDTDKIQAVVTLSAQAFVEHRTIEGIKEARAFFQTRNGLSKLEKFHGEKAIWVLNGWTNNWLDPAFATWSLDKYLANIKCPILAIHGDEDQYGSTDFPFHIVCKTQGFSRLRIMENTQHAPHREKPEAVLEITTNFLTDIASHSHKIAQQREHEVDLY